MPNPKTISIVLPCYNPLTGWLATIGKALAQLQSTGFSTELIIVNDGSVKNFDEALAQNELSNSSLTALKIMSYPENKGKGFALRKGVKTATGQIIIYTDIDFPYTQQSFISIYNALSDGSTDVAVGTRGEEYYTHLPKVRVRISKFLRFIIRTFLRIPTDDTQCGLKGFNQKGKEVFLQTSIDRYLFDLEFIYLAARKKLNIKTIEVQLRPGIELSHMRPGILLQEFGNFLKIFVKSIF